MRSSLQWRRNFAGIGGAMVAWVVLALASSAGASSAQPRGLYVALGDSIGAGNGASSFYKGYVELYYGHLRSNGSGVTNLLNLSVAGATTGSLRDDQLARAVAAINTSSDTKAVTIDVGINDLGGGPVAKDLRAILTGLKTALAADPGDETVQVMENYNPNLGTRDERATRTLLLGSDGKINCSGTGAALGINDLLHCISIELGARPVDVLPIFDAAGEAFLASDHLHPNDAGHLAIAKAFGGAATLPPALIAGKADLSRATAGKPFTVSVSVTDANTGEYVGGQVTCQGTLSGKSLRPRSHSSPSSARPSCTWQMPAAAHNKPFKGMITVRFHGSKVSRSFSTKVT